MIDYQQIKNNWPKIKSLVLSRWNKLADAEVEKTLGNSNSLEKLIEQSYGEEKDFDRVYEQLCLKALKNSSGDTEVAEKFMDKDRDDHYLMGENGVTRKAEINKKMDGMEDIRNHTVGEDGFNPTNADGFNNTNRHPRDYENWLNEKSKMNKDMGKGLSDKEQEELLQPDLAGMEATDAQTTPMKENTNTTQNKKQTASDETKPNQVPQIHTHEDIPVGRSNSSANTTSPSALTSSEQSKTH
jgi:hypothetical protein